MDRLKRRLRITPGRLNRRLFHLGVNLPIYKCNTEDEEDNDLPDIDTNSPYNNNYLSSSNLHSNREDSEESKQILHSSSLTENCQDKNYLFRKSICIEDDELPEVDENSPYQKTSPQNVLHTEKQYNDENDQISDCFTITEHVKYGNDSFSESLHMDTQSCHSETSDEELKPFLLGDDDHSQFNCASAEKIPTDKTQISLTQRTSVNAKQIQYEIEQIEVDKPSKSSSENIPNDDNVNSKIPLKTQNKITLSKPEWLTIKPAGSEGNQQRYLTGDWTVLLARKIDTICPGCVFTFKHNRVKRLNSRKINAPFFRGKALCKRQQCTLAVTFVLQHEPDNTSNEIFIQMSTTGSPDHSRIPGRRQLRGSERCSVAEKSRQVGAINMYYQNVQDTPQKQIQAGNLSGIPTANVIRKAVSECYEKERLHKDVIQELVLLKEAYKNDDDDPYDRYAGYIQYIAVDPFTVILFSTEQRVLLHFLAQTGPVDLYLDATGKVIRRFPAQRIPYLYSLVAKPKQSPPVSVCDFMTTDHSIPSISHFLLFFKRAVACKQSTFHVRKIETDWSWAIIQSALLAFSSMNVKVFLNVSFKVCNFDYNLENLTTVHICCAHMTKTVSAAMRKVSKNKLHHKFLMECFVVLCNMTSIVNTKSYFRDIVIALLSEQNSSTQQKAVSNIQKSISTLQENETSQNIGLFIEYPEEDTERHDEIAKEDVTIKEASPWTKLFRKIRKEAEESLKSETSHLSGLSSVYSPEALDILMNRFLPIFPLWSGVLLGDLSRYSVPDLVPVTQPTQPTRDSNAPVEAWFRVIKVDVLRRQTRLRPAEMISKMKRNINARIKEAKHPEIRTKAQTKKQKAEKLNLSEESWGKTKRRRRNLHQPDKNQTWAHNSNHQSTEKLVESNPGSNPPTTSRPIQKTKNEQPSTLQPYPSVPVWGGQASGHHFMNTCTIDNFLTILHMVDLDNTNLLHVLEQFSNTSNTPCIKTLISCLNLMREEKFTDAKLAWVTMTGDRAIMPNSINMFGNEHEAFASKFQALVKSSIQSKCSSNVCPHTVLQKRHNGCVLSCNTRTSESGNIQQMLDEWLSPPQSGCKRRIQVKANKTHISSLTDEILDVDTGEKKLIYLCDGQRSHVRRLESLPPVLVITLSDLISFGCLTKDVRKYSNILTLGEKTYNLAGVTQHRNSHFVCSIRSEKYGWLFYDGIRGYLLPYSCELVAECTPGHAIYVHTQS